MSDIQKACNCFQNFSMKIFTLRKRVNMIRRRDSPEFDSYVQDVYEIIDKVDAEFERRYNKDNIAIMKGITSLCPTSSKYLDQSALEEFAALFGADIEALSHEIMRRKIKSILRTVVNLETLYTQDSDNGDNG
ncbi:hypothetical protein HOLleu_15628 [Holothuria leucospilota]|uniref:Uncharacterized protein n=1 Tax=Holothuria leucospilota TaxID=206669 RepID=A0A9Q1C5G1_HOLLE|nr:hypothetical protein HOLleu_15628 [Holothuria leucospilota]